MPPLRLQATGRAGARADCNLWEGQVTPGLRQWLWLRYRRNRLNEQALVDTVIEIKGEQP